MSSFSVLLRVGLVLCVGVGAFFAGQIVDASNPGIKDTPDEEYNVACYKWVENGTAHVFCPDKVYAPDSWVNITVLECDEYEYANDEPHPCEGFGDRQ